MTTCFICLGKFGDILSALPLAAQHQESKPYFMVAKPYASLLERVHYVHPCVYEGDWTDLAGALKTSKLRFDRTICVATYGRNFPIEHRTTSFQLDAYKRANMLHLWDRLKLKIKSKASHPPVAGAILYADHSQSSPFLQKQELYELLRTEFCGREIIRLSEHKLSHLADFVGWYNSAAALVSVETAHLHLSAASLKPVIALATDRPSRWNGSAWSKRFAFYCRYSEFNDRREELVEALRRALAGKARLEGALVE